MMKKRNQKGFTLIEAVVATAVFSFVIASAFGVYLATIQLDTKSRSERSVQQNARFIMDYISKEIRNGSIDYSAAYGATSSTLKLTNQLDQTITFTRIGNSNDLTFAKSGFGSTTLNSSDVKVTALNFSVYPLIDPFVLANDVHIQPHVTVTMTLESTNTKTVDSAVMNVQSTFAVREYPSRQ
jgi:prepilin-type N-terminal cleavage/methylation domain-containing protein